MYNVDDKVETALGVGVIYGIRQYAKPIYGVKFNDDTTKVVEFAEHEIKPYVSAHDKLLAMGFKRIDAGGSPHALYNPDTRVLIGIDNKKFRVSEEDYCYRVDVPVGIDLELSRTLTQYLEELKDV